MFAVEAAGTCADQAHLKIETSDDINHPNAQDVLLQSLELETEPAPVRWCVRVYGVIIEAEGHPEALQNLASALKQQAPANLAPCRQCTEELHDPGNRRYRYPSSTVPTAAPDTA